MRFCALFAIVLVLIGCQTQPPAPVEKVGPSAPGLSEESIQDEARVLADVLSYGQRIPHMSSDEQKREVPALTQAMGRDRSLVSRLKLALLLSQPGAGVQDDVRALSLLEAYANTGPQAGPLRQFASFLHMQVAERMRGARRADQLKEQLEALRAVERSIIERGQTPQPRKP
ncbi:MAG TPA: hypothetical protein VJM53_10140 [Burkholderiales bacterium]|nr:hypothetical protein [Burkholderiales bacterium]